VFRPEEAPEAHAGAGGLRGEDVISASGKLVRRDESAVNPDLPTGEVELVVSHLDKLADAETPPFQIDEDDPVGEELRLRYRYLDMRKRPMAEAMALRHRVVSTIRRHLDEEGFLEIETPMLTRSTPEGARDFLVPSRLQPGSWYAGSSATTRSPAAFATRRSAPTASRSSHSSTWSSRSWRRPT
jgi:aspartyl-tRNA synthetase